MTLEANSDYLKARARADLEPEWRFRRPVAVTVGIFATLHQVIERQDSLVTIHYTLPLLPEQVPVDPQGVLDIVYFGGALWTAFELSAA